MQWNNLATGHGSQARAAGACRLSLKPSSPSLLTAVYNGLSSPTLEC